MAGGTRVGIHSNAQFKNVRDLSIGDAIEGLDEEMDHVICSVEAVGDFGMGPVFGNYTRDHFILDASRGVVSPNGADGEEQFVDKYAVLTSCPVGLDESGVGFTALDADFLGDEAIGWSDYVLIHQAILNIVREVGPSVFSPSTYTSISKVRRYTKRFYKTMLVCVKDPEKCDAFERAAGDLLDNTVTKKAKANVHHCFLNLGNPWKPGSIAAAVSKGRSVRE